MSKRAIRDKVRSEWSFWRPIMEKMSTYSEMCTLYDDEIAEFNAAIDILIEETNRQNKKQAKSK